MSSKTAKVDAPTNADAPLIAPLLQVSSTIIAALIDIRPVLLTVDDEDLPGKALEAANAHGLTWRLCENAAPQAAGDMVVFQFRADLIHSNGDIMYGYDVLNVAVVPRPDEPMSITARAVAHVTFIRSIFGFLTVNAPERVVLPQGVALQTIAHPPGPAATGDLNPASLETVEMDFPDEEDIDRSYLIAQTTPDGIPVLADLWEVADRKGQNRVDPEEICADSVHILTEYADNAPATGQLTAAWQHNKEQMEFIRDYDKAEFDKLVDAFDRNQNRIQEAPEVPNAQRNRRTRRRGRAA